MSTSPADAEILSAAPPESPAQTEQTTTPERIIGIDLGTTNSLAAAVFEHAAEALSSPEQGAMIPSVLSRVQRVGGRGSWIVGRAARELRTETPEQTIFSVKRLMGRDFATLEQEAAHLPYHVKPAQRGLVKVHVGQEAFTPQELSAEILRAVKRNAEAALGEPVHKAVITVPAYFDDAQRQATRDAGRIAGLEVMRILNEPTAAAIAYGLEQGQEGVIAVYDLGGGTFDISILKLSGQVFKVLATHGDTHLGGDDFDRCIADALKARLRQEFPRARLETPLAEQLLRKVAEEMKIDLSRSDETRYQISLPYAQVESEGRFTQQEMNTLIAPLVERTLNSCRQALDAAGCSVEEITETVLVGGSTRLPLVRERVEACFGKRPNLSIDPDLVVAIGAGIHGHLLTGGRRDYVLLDVIPLALGIETMGGAFSKLITANRTIPAQAEELFTTHVDKQSGVDINIYQGEREFVRDCRLLGRFRLRGLPVMPAGLPKVRVRFLVDTNGILTVSAQEERSGVEALIEVIPSHGLTYDEIERIMEESLTHAEEDMQQRQLVEFRTIADSVLRGLHRVWDRVQGLLDAESLRNVEQQMERVRDRMGLEDPLELKRALDALGELTRPLADTIISHAAQTELRRFYGQEPEAD